MRLAVARSQFSADIHNAFWTCGIADLDIIEKTRESYSYAIVNCKLDNV